jgi:hypothetical protein
VTDDRTGDDPQGKGPSFAHLDLRAFRLTPAVVTSVWDSPEREEIVSVGDFHLRLASSFIPRSMARPYQVIAGGQPGDRSPQFVIKVLQATMELVSDLTPSQVLRSIVDRFGVDIQIGNQVGRWFVEQTLPMAEQGTSLVKIVDRRNLKGHEVRVHPFVRARGAVIEVALAFSLDLTAYTDWLRKHGG